LKLSSFVLIALKIRAIIHSMKFAFFSLAFLFLLNLVQAEQTHYLVLSSESTAADPGWEKVINELNSKYESSRALHFPDGNPEGILEELRKIRPRYTCFVAKYSEVTRAMVSKIHQLTRNIDEDPYTDTIWGILTGYDSENALGIAKTREPLIIERVASGTEVALEHCLEGVWYCELNKGKIVRKNRNATPIELNGPADSTEALAKTLTEYKAQLFVTSGHATERGWQIGFSYRNGYFKSKNGNLFGQDTKGKTIAINSPNPKVYMPIGNCLMGHIDDQQAMALAWLKSGGVRQMLGYTVPTWYGYAGWGCLDYFVEQPGRYSFAEAFFANQHALIHRLETFFPDLASKKIADPNQATAIGSKVKLTEAATHAGLRTQDAAGLLFDRDSVVFYGDPGWDAKLAKGERAYEQVLNKKDSIYTFKITPMRGKKSFEPINTNGSQRGWRPIVHYFSERIGNFEILEGGELKPVLTDDFILIPNPKSCDPTKDYKVVFKASPL